jgi:hypothetical protein
MRCVRDDGWAQRGGIDRLVDLADGTTLKVDEKVRDCAYPDIALERWSNRARRTPGWVQKKLTCDYIAYAFVPTQRCYLLPFQTLRRAWRQHGARWIALAEADLHYPSPEAHRHRGQDGFSTVWADNGSYWTESIAVPIPALLDALTDAMVVGWS